MNWASRIFTWLFTLGILGTLAALFVMRAQEEPPLTQGQKVPSVKVGKPTVRDVSVTLSYPADLQAMTQYEIRPLEAKGTITYLKVDKGDKVKKGQLLVRVDCPEFHARRKRVVQWLEAAKAHHRQADVTYQRLAPMVGANYISPRELDQAIADRDSTLARVKNNLARLKEVDHLLEFCSIRAPFDGEVTMRWADPGGLVRPGGAPILALMNRDAMRLQLQMVERDILLVKEGQSVELEVNGLPGRTFEGEVTRVASMLDPRTRTFIVEVTVPNKDRVLQPGMYGRVSLTVGERKNSLVVPASAVLATDLGRWVFVVRDGIAKQIPVEIGHDTGEDIEIAKGLRAEDTLVILGRDLIRDGSPVVAR